MATMEAWSTRHAGAVVVAALGLVACGGRDGTPDAGLPADVAAAPDACAEGTFLGCDPLGSGNGFICNLGQVWEFVCECGCDDTFPGGCPMCHNAFCVIPDTLRQCVAGYPGEEQQCAYGCAQPLAWCEDARCNECTPGATECHGDVLVMCGPDGLIAQSMPCASGCVSTPAPACPVDCSSVPGACGDGVCGPVETCVKCPADCGTCGGPTCGDGTCDASESCVSCFTDCGACPPVCGDGACTGGEDCAGCPGDCCDVCGDGLCRGGEDCASCADDCCGACGDGACMPPEHCGCCPWDCGLC